MPRLTREQINRHKDWLYEWKNPKEMLDYCNQIMDFMGRDTHNISVALFNQAGVDFLLEGHVAATFAIARGDLKVRLISDERPDFQILASHGEENWELTEADIFDRRRGEENKASAVKKAAGLSAIEHDPVENWHERADQIPTVLRDRAKKKSDKVYLPSTKLLIYLNVALYGIRQQETEDCMCGATELAKDKFEEVWVLWNDRVYQLWVEGQPPFFQPGVD